MNSQYGAGQAINNLNHDYSVEENDELMNMNYLLDNDDGGGSPDKAIGLSQNNNSPSVSLAQSNNQQYNTNVQKGFKKPPIMKNRKNTLMDFGDDPSLMLELGYDKNNAQQRAQYF